MTTLHSQERSVSPLTKFILAFLLILAMDSYGVDASAQGKERLDSEIHTVLPFDGIPAVFDLTFVTAQEATVEPTSPMIGVSLNGEKHAYSCIMLNHHEIVNDVVGGVPIATTW